MSWTNLPQIEDEIDGSIPEPPVYKEPDTKTELVDLASESEKPKVYVQKEGEVKKFQERKESGEIKASTPVDIYEPGFRSDMYDAILNFFKEKKKMQHKHAALKEKMGWR